MAEWQTQQTQNLPGATSCGFKSRLRHLTYGTEPDSIESGSVPFFASSCEKRIFPGVRRGIPCRFNSSCLFGALDRPCCISERQEIRLKILLEKGADPNRVTYPHPRTGKADRPIHTAVIRANEVLRQFSKGIYELNIKKYEAAKKQLFQVLNLLIKYGADFEDWADHQTWGNETWRTVFFDDFVPKEDAPYEIEYCGKIIKGITEADPHREIRAAIQEYVIFPHLYKPLHP